MTHKEELLAWFKRGLTITPAEAVDYFNNYRLADTVFNLREDGHTISTEICERVNSAGRRTTYARYTYISGPNDLSASENCDVAERQRDGLPSLWGAVRGGVS